MVNVCLPLWSTRPQLFVRGTGGEGYVGSSPRDTPPV